MTKQPGNAEELLDLVRKSGVIEESRLEPYLRNPAVRAAETKVIAATLVKNGVLTAFQASCLLAGRYKGLVLGAYKILDKIGQGGMGTVYLGEHTGLNRRVAIKVLTVQQAAQDQLATERFYREARSAAALDHPNIVRVYDVSSMGAAHYIVMEYVEGQTLRQLVEKTGPLHYAQAADYIAQAAAGLQQAYEKNLVHRDIKPENLILDKAGTVKILDLGLARPHGDNKQALTEKLEPNVILGTPDYLAPEQAMDGSTVDVRADIYSLGATFFTLVSGRPPFQGNTAQKLAQHQLADPPSLSKIRPNVPPQLSAIVARMLAKKPEDRFQTPVEVVEALTPWLHAGSGEVVPAPVSAVGLPAALSRSTSKSRVGIPAPAEEDGDPAAFRRRQRLYIGGGVAAGVLLVVGLAVAFSGGGKKKDEASPGPNPAPNTVAVAPPVTPAVAPPTATPPKPAPTTVCTLNLSGVTPFSLTMQEKNATETHARGQLPAPWLADVYKPASFKNGIPVGEFAVTEVEGQKVFSLKNIEGTFVQFYTGRAVGRIKMGNTYTFRIEYRTSGHTHGEIGVRGGVSGLLPTTRFPLSDTDGHWKTTEFVLEAARDIPLFVIIQNLDNGPDNLLEVRSFSVTEQAP